MRRALFPNRSAWVQSGWAHSACSPAAAANRAEADKLKSLDGPGVCLVRLSFCACRADHQRMMDHQAILDRLLEFQRAVRDAIVRSRSASSLHEVNRSSAADTIYQID